MPKLLNDPSYSKQGSFPKFITQTDEKEVTLRYILDKLKEKYDSRDYKKFTFTDIGAGEGTLTLPIIQYLGKQTNLESYCIEPSSLIELLRKKCGPKVHYIQEGMEETDLPKSDFILIAHAMQYLQDRRKFAKSLKKALNPHGKILVVGAHRESDDLRFKRELKPKKVLTGNEKPKENLFEYLEQEGFKITREYLKSTINISEAQRVRGVGKDIISFFYHKPFSEISNEEIRRFQELSRKFAPDGKLTKLLQFIWVE